VLLSAAPPMELELGQLDLRYESLRTRSALRERRVLASIAQVGQQMPIIVVCDGGAPIVVDGYERVRTLRRLRHDTVRATAWELSEADALVLERLLRAGEADSAIEQGWFLREMTDRFGLSRDELARRFDRTPSWVSRRLALVMALPASVQNHVRSGAIGAHAAMKYLVPLARANEGDCERLADAIAPSRPSSRQMAELCATYAGGNVQTRELCMRDPLLVLRARQEQARGGSAERTPVEHLLDDLGIVGAVVRRARGRLVRGAIDGATEPQRAQVGRASAEAAACMEALKRQCDQELNDAR
jgi:ParB-like chromosome segregation protein Spo0J